MLILVVGLLCIAGAGAQVTCTDKVDVTPHRENATFTSTVEDLKEEENTVLGYTRYTIKNPNYNELIVSPCLAIAGLVSTGSTEAATLAEKKIQVLVQPWPLGDAFCMTTNKDGDSQLCAVNEMLYCADAIEDMKFEFVCDQQSCEKAQINLYVKVTVSDSSQAGEIEYWCDEQNATYPSSLISTIPDKQKNYDGTDDSQDRKTIDNSSSVPTIAFLALLTAFIANHILG